ncbi:MauE/DoxX family redox-associated membrane protein [Empedobacter falsenii]|nr:MauE/DoxX family redox-associated membrane protein [Empedobacter falsenii]QLL57794.1 hypothetical protein FH779_06755 [Empedobacter falsenii]
MRKIAPFLRTLICYLYISLFVYAAVSKLIDFETFQTQLGQSPLLASYAIPISYGVIILELLTAVLLMFERTRKLALQISLFLMTIFTTYIIIILNFTDFTPCSCGGVLEKLGWTEHLIFNLVFVGFALCALRLVATSENWKNYGLNQLGILVIGIASVSILYALSEKKSQTNNAFTRKYIPHALQKIKQITLPSNDYYIAGIDSCAIYLGNYNAPLYVKEIDFNLFTEKTHQIIIDQYNLPYKRVRIVVQPPYFFVGDGTVPILFRGKITNWKASTLFKEKIYFNQFVPKDSATIAVVTASTKTNTTILGEIKLKPNQLMFTPKEDILVKQINGTFDTDGLLQWNNQAHLYTYLYYYRNQYIVLDQNLQPIVHNKTIDTISKAQIDLAYFEKSKEYKLGS